MQVGTSAPWHTRTVKAVQLAQRLYGCHTTSADACYSVPRIAPYKLTAASITQTVQPKCNSRLFNNMKIFLRPVISLELPRSIPAPERYLLYLPFRADHQTVFPELRAAPVLKSITVMNLTLRRTPSPHLPNLMK